MNDEVNFFVFLFANRLILKIFKAMTHRFLTAAEYFKNAAKTVYLYKQLWSENSTALLHAPRETDKTAKAIEIACDAAKTGRKVVYVACERRIVSHADTLSKAPSSLSICVPTFESPEDKTDYADLVISTIEEIVRDTDIRTFVIDSVTRIAALSFGRNASVAYVMKRLVALQVRCKLSLLVISHDSTKSTERALLTLSDSEITIEAASVESEDINDCKATFKSDPKPTTQQARQSHDRRACYKNLKI